MKVFGLPLWGIVVGTIVFWLIGGVWYGALFTDIWMRSEGITPEMVEGLSTSPLENLWMLGGVLISAVMVIGIGLVLKWRGWPDIQGAITTALVLWVCFALTTLGYDLVYVVRHDLGGYLVDISYNLLGWVASAIILTLMR